MLTGLVGHSDMLSASSNDTWLLMLQDSGKPQEYRKSWIVRFMLPHNLVQTCVFGKH